MPEYDLAIRLGVDPGSVLEDIFPTAKRKTPPTDLGELRARTRVLSAARARLGAIHGMNDIAGSLARAGMDSSATDVIKSLLEREAFVAPVRAVVTGDLSASLESLTPDPGITDRLTGREVGHRRRLGAVGSRTHHLDGPGEEHIDAVGRVAGPEQVLTLLQPTLLPRSDDTLEFRIGQHFEEIDAPEDLGHLFDSGCGLLTH